MAKTTNGDLPNSQFINHLTSYPLISDALSTYQQNSLGAKSIDVFHQLYATVATPVLPYLKTPYSILHPYLVKADSLGDASLAKVDERFPAVKSTNFESIKSTTFSIAGYPIKLASDGKTYVFNTYGDEYKKTKGATGSDSLINAGKAVISTELRIAQETLAAAWAIVSPYKDDAFDKLDAVKKAGAEKLGQAQKKGNETVAHAQKKGDETVAHAKKKGHEVKANGL